MRLNGTLMSSILISALALSAAPALAADRVDGSAEMQAALQRDLGLTAEQAKEQGDLQERAIELDQKLQDALGDGFAGSHYDPRGGRLVVSVSDRSLLEKVKAAGAEPRLVERSLRELSAIKADIDSAAGLGPDTRPEQREAVKPQSTAFTSWAIDPVSNSVKVTATRAQYSAARELVAKYGEGVTVELSEAVPEPAANWMDGGDAINSSTCSAGFNLRNPSTGQGYLLTAGHCVNAGSTLRGQGGVSFGPVLESWFPTFDDAIARNTNPGYWIQGPWVDTNPSNGGFLTVHGYTDAPVGTIMCKSGITTKWTCGQIKAKNETVTYSDGSTIFGMTRHSACVEPGDSGGANLSLTTAFRPEGVTSGARMRKDANGKRRCLSKFGEQNVSWYFPIADSLAYYGWKYGVTTW